jgi:hypothetical protein
MGSVTNEQSVLSWRAGASLDGALRVRDLGDRCSSFEAAVAVVAGHRFETLRRSKGSSASNAKASVMDEDSNGRRRRQSSQGNRTARRLFEMMLSETKQSRVET